MEFDTQLCLVSAQATPNLSPVLDPGFRPRRVVLVVSPDMESRADWLSVVLERHGVLVETLDIADAYDFNGCWETILEWLGKQSGTVALNVTGGTKVMAMAAQDVFREMGRPVFYVNVENDQVIRIDQRATSFVLPTKIRLREYLEVHGYGVAGKPPRPDISAERRDFINRLAYESRRLGYALGRINWLAQQAKNNLQSPPLDSDDLDSRSLDELISMFAGQNLLKLSEGKLVFPGEEARQLVNGGWLELLVYQALAQLAPEIGIADYAVGLEVTAADGRTKNELDAACIYRNTLHMIECKSANLASNKDGRSGASDALYKLEALRKMGGSRTRAMLVDYRGGLSDYDKGRAAQMGIKILSGDQLRDIRGELKGWIRGAG